MNFTDIINLLDSNLDLNDLRNEVDEKMKANNPDYEESENIFYEQITKLNENDLIESNVNNMLSITERAYYSEGFRHGVQFIIEQLSGHKIDIDSLLKLLTPKSTQEPQESNSFDDFIISRVDEVLSNNSELETIQGKIISKEHELRSCLNENGEIFNEYDSLTGEQQGMILNLVYKAAFEDGRRMPFI